jgi:stage V sporulation protein AC
LNISNKQYDLLTKQASPSSPKLKNSIFAFFLGGAICLLGQALGDLYMYLGAKQTDARTWVSVTIIGLTALLTGLHLWSHFAKVAGAGAFVPISGFANSVVSPAIEFKSEGFILGVGANMFKIAGPVIVYGTVASVVYGVIYWVMTQI